MQNFSRAFATFLLLSVTSSISADEVKLGTVNFQKCIQTSKLGQFEQQNFEVVKKEMEKVLEEKEKELQDLAGKLNDADYLDSISLENETELKRKARTLQQDLGQVQQQYYQALQQTNYRIIQDLTQKVSDVSKLVAQEEGFDLILNDETLFFSNNTLDVSSLIIDKLDAQFDSQSSEREKEALLQKLPTN